MVEGFDLMSDIYRIGISLVIWAVLAVIAGLILGRIIYRYDDEE